MGQNDNEADMAEVEALQGRIVAVAAHALSARMDMTSGATEEERRAAAGRVVLACERCFDLQVRLLDALSGQRLAFAVRASREAGAPLPELHPEDRAAMDRAVAPGVGK